MDCWNSGIVGIKMGNNRFFVFLLPNPSFHYSITPMFHLGKPPEFQCDKQVTKKLLVKLRNLRIYDGVKEKKSMKPFPFAETEKSFSVWIRTTKWIRTEPRKNEPYMW